MAESARASWWELYDLWPLERIDAFDRAIEEFDAAWRGGKDPSPGILRDQATADEWPFWLAELLAIEMIARRDRGQALREEEFLERFPDNAETVRLAWTEAFAEPVVGPTQIVIPPRDQAQRHLFPTGYLLDGRYIIDRFVQRGGMGEVYRGHRIEGGRAFAFKALHVRKTGQQDNENDAEDHRTSLGRFLREMDILADLRHPHLVSSNELLRLPHLPPVIVMDWVDGKDLRSLVRGEGPLSIADACEIIRQAADGLDYAWRQHAVVHRDIKPANIMLTSRGEAKVLDFGLARARSSALGGNDDDLTISNVLLGTPDFMAPEQWDDPRNVTSAVDVYGLGITLFFLLTGKTPFIDRTSGPPLQALRQAHEGLAPPDVRKLRPEVDAGLARLIVDRMLAKEAKDRPAMCVVAKELEAWAVRADLAGAAEKLRLRETNAPAPGFWTRRKFIVVVCAAGGAAAAATMFRSLPIPQVLDLALSVYEAPNEQTGVKKVGEVGRNLFSVDAGSPARLQVRLDAPAYVQLIAANSDGEIQLLASSAAEHSASLAELGRVDAFTFPRQEFWELDEDAGLQAFVLVTSRKPLPSFDEWAAQARLRQLWAPRISGAGIWQSRDGTIQPVTPEDETPRGHLLKIVPAPLQTFWDGILTSLPGRAQLALLAFPLV